MYTRLVILVYTVYRSMDYGINIVLCYLSQFGSLLSLVGYSAITTYEFGLWKFGMFGFGHY